MNEIKEVVILAAGRGKRLGDLTRETNKCLLPYKTEPILHRLFRQLSSYNIRKITLVVGYKKEKVIALTKKFPQIDFNICKNDLYEKDVNIYSLKLAMERMASPFVLLEADAIMEDALVGYIVGSDFEGKSIWYTHGEFKPPRYGGILKSNKYGMIVDIKIVPAYADKYKGYSKLTGLMRIGPKEIRPFKKYINEYAAKTIEQYYLVPWMENLASLPCFEGNAQPFRFATFNNPKEYNAWQNTDFDGQLRFFDIKLVDPKRLLHIEGYDQKRVEQLTKKIIKERNWTHPVFVEKKHRLILDGQHRVEAALRLGLKRIPVQGFNYKDIPVWSLRKEEVVDVRTVIQRAKDNNIYPHKTVKHKFPKFHSANKIPIKDLK